MTGKSRPARIYSLLCQREGIAVNRMVIFKTLNMTPTA